MSVNIDDDVVDVISFVALFYEKGKSGNSFLRKEKFRAQLPRRARLSWKAGFCFYIFIFVNSSSNM